MSKGQTKWEILGWGTKNKQTNFGNAEVVGENGEKFEHWAIK
jgi:hypothetical protein